MQALKCLEHCSFQVYIPFNNILILSLCLYFNYKVITVFRLQNFQYLIVNNLSIILGKCLDELYKITVSILGLTLSLKHAERIALNPNHLTQTSRKLPSLLLSFLQTWWVDHFHFQLWSFQEVRLIIKPASGKILAFLLISVGLYLIVTVCSCAELLCWTSLLRCPVSANLDRIRAEVFSCAFQKES